MNVNINFDVNNIEEDLNLDLISNQIVTENYLNQINFSFIDKVLYLYIFSDNNLIKKKYIKVLERIPNSDFKEMFDDVDSFSVREENGYNDDNYVVYLSSLYRENENFRKMIEFFLNKLSNEGYMEEKDVKKTLHQLELKSFVDFYDFYFHNTNRRFLLRIPVFIKIILHFLENGRMSENIFKLFKKYRKDLLKNNHYEHVIELNRFERINFTNITKSDTIFLFELLDEYTEKFPNVSERIKTQINDIRRGFLERKTNEGVFEENEIDDVDFNTDYKREENEEEEEKDIEVKSAFYYNNIPMTSLKCEDDGDLLLQSWDFIKSKTEAEAERVIIHFVTPKGDNNRCYTQSDFARNIHEKLTNIERPPLVIWKWKKEVNSYTPSSFVINDNIGQYFLIEDIILNIFIYKFNTFLIVPKKEKFIICNTADAISSATSNQTIYDLIPINRIHSIIKPKNYNISLMNFTIDRNSLLPNIDSVNKLCHTFYNNNRIQDYVKKFLNIDINYQQISNSFLYKLSELFSISNIASNINYKVKINGIETIGSYIQQILTIYKIVNKNIDINNVEITLIDKVDSGFVFLLRYLESVCSEVCQVLITSNELFLIEQIKLSKINELSTRKIARLILNKIDINIFQQYNIFKNIGTLILIHMKNIKPYFQANNMRIIKSIINARGLKDYSSICVNSLILGDPEQITNSFFINCGFLQEYLMQPDDNIGHILEEMKKKNSIEISQTAFIYFVDILTFNNLTEEFLKNIKFNFQIMRVSELETQLKLFENKKLEINLGEGNNKSRLFSELELKKIQLHISYLEKQIAFLVNDKRSYLEILDEIDKKLNVIENENENEIHFIEKDFEKPIEDDMKMPDINPVLIRQNGEEIDMDGGVFNILQRHFGEREREREEARARELVEREDDEFMRRHDAGEIEMDNEDNEDNEDWRARQDEFNLQQRLNFIIVDIRRLGKIYIPLENASLEEQVDDAEEQYITATFNFAILKLRLEFGIEYQYEEGDNLSEDLVEQLNELIEQLDRLIENRIDFPLIEVVNRRNINLILNTLLNL